MGMQREKVDWIGRWFPVMDAMGEDTSIRYIEVNPDTHKEIHYALPHEKFDGIGGLCHLTASAGLNIGSPPSMNTNKVSLFRKLTGFWHYLQKSKPFHTSWIFYDSNSQQAKTDLIWRGLTRDETKLLRKMASEKKYSLNSILIHTIDSICRRTLLRDDKAVCRWWIPVNLRGIYDLENPFGNHSSHILIDVRPQSSIGDLHQNIKKELKSGFQFGALASSLWSKYLSFNLMKNILEGYKKKNHCCMGTISHFGEWSPPTVDQRSLWVGNPPSTVSFPLSFGLTVWNEQLLISLHCHQALCPMKLSPELILETVVDKLKGILYAHADQHPQLPGTRDCDSH